MAININVNYQDKIDFQVELKCARPLYFMYK